MKKVTLVHQALIQHYRVPIYNYLSEYLVRHGYLLTVVSEGIQEGNTVPVTFSIEKISLGFLSLIRHTRKSKPDVVILFVNHSRNYLFPYIFYLATTKVKSITWTHGLDLQTKNSFISQMLHTLEHELCNGIILYAEQLRPQILLRHRKKAFTANNTLNLFEYDNRKSDKDLVLKKYGITTLKNIISVGRIHRRKRIEDLISAFNMINRPEIGLILAGPDEDGIIKEYADKNRNIFVTGPVYGNDVIDLLRACDVYCIPGAIGLSIVDAMYCGLPVVTQNCNHGPEIMYLKNGVNGYIVERGNLTALAESINRLLTDEKLRSLFSTAARNEITTNGHIDKMCKGFIQCLAFVTRQQNLVV